VVWMLLDYGRPSAGGPDSVQGRGSIDSSCPVKGQRGIVQFQHCPPCSDEQQHARTEVLVAKLLAGYKRKSLPAS